MKELWVVWTNTDLTEGKGYEVPLYICMLESTAIRLAKGVNVQGSDGRISSIANNGEGTHVWAIAPVKIVFPSKEDKDRELKILQFRAIANKALELGLSTEEIKILAQE